MPRWGKGEGSGNIGTINWSKCVGCEVKFIYDDVEGFIKITDYSRKNNGLIIKYLNNKSFNITTGDFTRCRLGGVLKKRTSDFKIKIGQTFKDEKRDITIIDRKYTKDKRGVNWKAYKYKCNICGFDSGKYYRNGDYEEELWIREADLLKGCGCACCCTAPQITVQGINDMYTTDYWMVELGVDKEFAKIHTSRSGVKCKVECPLCGNKKEIKINSIYNYKSIGCVCGDGVSYPEKFMYNILQQLNIKFKTQYSPKWIKPKRYDFYIPSKNLIIEIDGELGHKGGKIHKKSKYTLEELIKIDNWKDIQAQLHRLEVVRINCFESNMEYIKNNILNSELINYFNFENIDWEKADEHAWKSNLKKEVCEYWNNKEEWETTADLSSKFELNKGTITRYLNKGVKLGWNSYNGLTEIKKRTCKPIEILKDDIRLGEFESSSELARQSKEIFGVKLDNTAISSFAKGRYNSKTYKGFTFKYIEDNKNCA